MAIIKCDDVIEEVEIAESTGSATTTVEPYVEQDEVSLGKTLLAVEGTSFSPSTPFVDVLPEVRNTDISDTLRADAGLYWYLSDEGKMVHPILGYILPSVQLRSTITTASGMIGMTSVYEFIQIVGSSTYFTSSAQWEATVEGTTESRPTPLVPLGQTFSDHAFQMNTPFSKKELEMFTNISNAVSVADVESDYDFFDKTYEEAISSTTVPENSLPHLYTEVQRGESNDENTTELPEGYFRDWMKNIFSDQGAMDAQAKAYENVAILDSVVEEGEIIGSQNRTISAFDILMAYANRENLFPMNVNIEIDTNNASDLMFEAEDVGMVDDIVNLVLGHGDLFPPEPEGGGGGGSPSAEEVDLGGGGEGSPSGEEDEGGGGESSPSNEGTASSDTADGSAYQGEDVPENTGGGGEGSPS